MSAELPPGAVPWPGPLPAPPPPPPPPPPSPAARAVRRRVPGGLGDFFVVFGAQLGGAFLTQIAYVLLTGNVAPDDIPTAVQFTVFLPGQIAGGFVALFALARVEGRRDLRREVGWVVSRRDWWALPLGSGLQIVILVLSIPFVVLFDDDRSAQEVVEVIEQTRGVGVWLAIVVGVGFLQPVLEEVMFRGFLLQALLRKTTPGWAIAISSAAFGLAHLTGISVGLEGLSSIVMLTGLGVVLAVLTLERRSLGPAVLAHSGFNLFALLVSAAAS